MPAQPIAVPKDRTANIHIAVLYAKEDQEAWEELEKQFTSINARYPNVHIWTATDLDIGGSVGRQFKEELKRADITLLLFSPEFVNDTIVDEEVRELLSNYAQLERKSGLSCRSC
ncbi:MAG: TIR domain-containing protein [Phaeodactylibacter sp.]|nr:TIR domain-containing protein [Phaeodactylibacter sp.]